MVNFQEELNKIFDPLKEETRQNINKEDEKKYMDFGMGKAQQLNPMYLYNGIIL